MTKTNWLEQKSAIDHVNGAADNPDLLNKYRGWGSFKDIFKPDAEGWAKQAQQELKEYLNCEEKWRTIKNTTTNSFYTPQYLIDHMWQLVYQYCSDTTTLKVLEPGCGSGRFIKSAPMVFKDSQFIGVEIDPLAAQIAQELNPTATIYNLPFEKVSLPENYFDLVIGNVPYGGQGEVYDPEFDSLNLTLHDYFIAKSLKLLRPGGLMVILTGIGTLDKKDSQFREYLAGKATFLTLKDFKKSDLANPVLKKYYDKLKAKVESQEEDQLVLNPGDYFILDSKAKLIDVWRLPHGALIDTEACADILVIQKLQEDEVTDTTDWVKADYTINGLDLNEEDNNCVNVYFEYNPDRILGEFCVDKLTGHRVGVKTTLNNNIEDLTDNINPSVESILEGSTDKIKLLIPPELQSAYDGEFVKWFSKWHQRIGDELIEVPSSISSYRGRIINDYHQRIEEFKKLFNLLNGVISAQYTATDKQLLKYQEALDIVYTQWVSKFGLLNDRVNTQILDLDPNYLQVMALEQDSEDGYVKADIFIKRVGRNFKCPKKVSRFSDAVKYCLNLNQELNPQFIADLLDKPLEEVKTQLLESGMCFYDPEIEDLVPEDLYLSGNVRHKLRVAQDAGLESNIQALKLIQPIPLVPINYREEIMEKLEYQGEVKNLIPSLGSTWIPLEIVNQFIEEKIIPLLRRPIESKAIYLSECATWVFKIDDKIDDYSEYGVAINLDEFGETSPADKRVGASEILEMALNQRVPNFIIKSVTPEGNTYKNQKATDMVLTLVRSKIERMKKVFEEWVFEDIDRAVSLTKRFNDTCNNYRSRWNKDWLDKLKANPNQPYPGKWLELPGLNKSFNPRPHQKALVQRAIVERALIAAHDVGTGKTASYVMSIMENRRLGLVHKPVLVVLNGTEQQIYKEFKELYPTANVILPPKLHKHNRRKFFASLVVRDFDCVILTHPQFAYLNCSTEFEQKELNLEIALYEQLIKELIVEYAVGETSDTIMFNDPGAKTAYQSCLQATKRLTTRLKRARKRALVDDSFSFEKICDYLIVDEAHEYRKMPIQTKMVSMPGIQQGESNKAFEFRLKAHYLLGFLNSMKGFKGKILIGTGTLIVNSLCEIYSWQKCFQLDKLREGNIIHFDEWAATFAVISEQGEMTSTGQWKVKQRARGFKNLLALRGMMQSVIDIVTHEQVNFTLDKPKAEYIDVKTPLTENHKRFLKILLDRAEAVKNRAVKPTEDNYLKITGDMVKCGINLGLIGIEENDKLAKLNQVAANVFTIYKATEKVRGTQIIFCDFSVPKKGYWNAYQYIKDMFCFLGGDPDEFQFIHDHSGQKRKQLFEDINSGKVRIIMGSTGKLGTGCNVQKWGLYAAHHIDATWVPSGIEQREGRIIRQGNGINNVKLEQCLIFRYITETMDCMRWQILEAKQRLIDEFFSNVSGLNESNNDIGGNVSLTYNQIKALASGNPALIEKAELEKQVAELKIQYDNFKREKSGADSLIKKHKKSVVNINNKIKLFNEFIEITTPISDSIKVRDYNNTNKSRLIEKKENESLKSFKNRVGNLILLRITAVEKSNMQCKALLMPAFRGFDIFIDNQIKILNNNQILLLFRKAGDKEGAAVPIPFTISQEMYTRLELFVDGINELIDSFQTFKNNLQLDLDKLANDIDRLKLKKEGEFDKLDELVNKETRLKQIEESLEDNDIIGGGDDNNSNNNNDKNEEDIQYFDFSGAIPYREPCNKSIKAVQELIEELNLSCPYWLKVINLEISRVLNAIKEQ